MPEGADCRHPRRPGHRLFGWLAGRDHTGIHLDRLLTSWGIAKAMKPRSLLFSPAGAAALLRYLTGPEGAARFAVAGQATACPPAPSGVTRQHPGKE